MIIGTILNANASPSNPGEVLRDGFTSITFYTITDAVIWAELQSQNFQVASLAQYCLCSVINTDDSTRRWWYAGTEYTG